MIAGVYYSPQLDMIFHIWLVGMSVRGVMLESERGVYNVPSKRIRGELDLVWIGEF